VVTFLVHFFDEANSTMTWLTMTRIKLAIPRNATNPKGGS
jgi:hypothetical protein